MFLHRLKGRNWERGCFDLWWESSRGIERGDHGLWWYSFYWLYWAVSAKHYSYRDMASAWQWDSATAFCLFSADGLGWWRWTDIRNYYQMRSLCCILHLLSSAHFFIHSFSPPWFLFHFSCSCCNVHRQAFVPFVFMSPAAVTGSRPKTLLHNNCIIILSTRFARNKEKKQTQTCICYAFLRKSTFVSCIILHPWKLGLSLWCSSWFRRRVNISRLHILFHNFLYMKEPKSNPLNTFNNSNLNVWF